MLGHDRTVAFDSAAKCIAQAKGEIPVEVITKGESSDSGDWLGKPPEIAEKGITTTYDTNVLVVGCGTGGMFAVAAAEEGEKVIGIDLFPTGTGIRDDLGAINSRYQKAYETKIDKFDFVTAATQYAAGHLSQDLVKLWCDRSGEAIDWYGDRLAERGIRLVHESGDKVDQSRCHHFPTGRSPAWPYSIGGGKIQSASKGPVLTGNIIFHDYAVKKGARFDYETTMVKLERKGGRVAGCIARNSEGKYVRYNAHKGVVVATGGYSQNYPMMEALQPWNLRIIGRNGSMPGVRGDGIRACLWVDAKMDETHSMMMFDRCALRPDQKVAWRPPSPVTTAFSGWAPSPGSR
ncbi:MAG: FAD-binding protein [Mesosutterella sp.]|nr:FAD-binding protein [Mesosutterella sp.]